MLKLSQKLLLLLLVVALIPLGIVNLYWFHSAQSSLRAAAVKQQTILTANASYRVNQYVTDKINALIIHSQNPSVQKFDIANAQLDLTSLIKQDNDIQTLTLTDANGIVQAAINRQTTLPTGADISTQDAFRAATYLAGKEYISPVSFNNPQNEPFVTIAAPLVTFETGQTLSQLSTAQSSIIRAPQAIKGALIETVDLDQLWQSVLSQTSGSQGYAYLVDSQGALIAYPNSAFLASHPNLTRSPEVAAFLANPTASAQPVITTSEKGSSVLSSYQQVPRTSWGVITEVPLSSIFATANRVGEIGIGIFGVVTLLIVLLSYVISRQITNPIRQLVAGAAQISEGKLDIKITTRSHDEIGTLARAFNSMGGSLAAILQRAKAEANKVNVIINNVGEGIIAVDAEGKIILANTAAAVLIGELPRNIIGKPVNTLFPWVSNEKLFQPQFSDVQVYKELTITNLNKRVHFVDMLVNPIMNDPTGIHAILTILDRTSERELENMKVDFVSMAAHELRTPLTTIRGYLDLIMQDEEHTLPGITRDYVEHIESSSVQLVGLISNLLSVSKIERGALTLRIDKIDWVKLVQRCITDQQFTARIKTITLKYEGPEEPIYILADRLAITEVVNNLINNAINYTNNAGHVTVQLSQTEKGVVTAVIDDGVGIPAAALDHLFTKFFRARSGLTSGSGGTGLGLFISKSIMELHNGSITVDSVEGEGSTFTIVLPKFDEARYNEVMKLRSNSPMRKHGNIT